MSNTTNIIRQDFPLNTSPFGDPDAKPIICSPPFPESYLATGQQIAATTQGTHIDKNISFPGGSIRKTVLCVNAIMDLISVTPANK